MMKILLRAARYALTGLFALTVLGLLSVAGAYYYLTPQLPSIEVLRDVQFQVPLRIYTRDGELIAEFGEMKRTPLRYDEIPKPLVNAFLAAEDDRFFEHPGVDYQGLIRAGLLMITTGEKRQGGSTITMQTAKNFLLSSEKSFIRKAKEIILSLQMEQTFSKEEILELYLNKIYLGQRAYGLAAAAQVYYGKSVDELEIPEIAMIAGLPKAPSTSNPITNPDGALSRRNYVLRRMNELGYLSNEEYQTAITAPITAQLHSQPVEVEAPYVAEMIRSEMVTRFGKEEAYTQGYKVYTSIDGRLQRAANRSLRNALQEYDSRHGYRGMLAHIALDEQADESTYREALKSYSKAGDLTPALVLAVSEQSAEVVTADSQILTLEWAGLEWAKPYIDENRVGDAPTTAGQILKRGDIIHILNTGENSWRLAQIPEVSGALVSLNPNDGALLALVGGYDFYQSKFNRVMQAERQPGSNFKPFIYSAALDNGFTLASIINDAPVVFDDAELEGEWRPENYSGKFYGPTRLREALVRSRNLVSIRLLRSIGIGTAIRHVKAFGFDTNKLPRDLSLSLGSATLTPYELVRGYAVLANGGYLIEPYYIERIENRDGEIIEQVNPLIVCHEEPCSDTAAESAEINSPLPASETVTGNSPEQMAQEPVLQPRYAERTVSVQNVYMITSIMQDVIKRGTGIKARSLGRNDIAGKTGTTNDQRDAWFSGFNPDVVATTWVGFDTPHPLGNGETGGRAALPMWIDYMEEALKDKAEGVLKEPPGMITVRIDPETGEYAGIDNENAIFEIFTVENAPKAPVSVTQPNPALEQGNSGSSDITNQLF